MKEIRIKNKTCHCCGDLAEGFNYEIVWSDKEGNSIVEYWLDYEVKNHGETWKQVVKYLYKFKGLWPEQISRV